MGRLTLWGMQQSYPTLLQGIDLPDGMSIPDFIIRLNMKVGQQYPYIQVPPVLQQLISTWFATRQTDFQRMYDAMEANYSPIENYDRKEDRKLKTSHSGTDTDTNTLGTTNTVTRTGTESMQTTGTEKTVTSGTETTQSSGTSTTENSVSAYDASSYVPRDKQTQTPNLTDTRTPNLTDTRTPDITEKRTPDLTDVSSNTGSDVRKTDYGHVEDATEEVRAHGNIGVTTNQQMIESEMELRMKWDLYEVIIQMFEREFMSRVY